ncbi:DUF1580 domain-containing protein [Planctomicrobium sp. SH661]|uniref:DUF1580 domain-containing protein n=1 Tax=Planctomicrobium sp. SH661 TaxID=3448124 RepID=UPI003F5BE0D2
MIDLKTENVLSMTDATKQLPTRRRGKRIAVSTLYRWADRGLRGRRLETITIGGAKCASLEALQRFFEELEENAASPVRSTHAVGEAQAARKLDAEGW